MYYLNTGYQYPICLDKKPFNNYDYSVQTISAIVDTNLNLIYGIAPIKNTLGEFEQVVRSYNVTEQEDEDFIFIDDIQIKKTNLDIVFSDNFYEICDQFPE